MLVGGRPMANVSEMLRHSSIGITVDTYGHLSEDTARVASDAMAAALEQAFETAAAAAGDRGTRAGFRVGDHGNAPRPSPFRLLKSDLLPAMRL